jgi:hypothetical protein
MWRHGSWLPALIGDLDVRAGFRGLRLMCGTDDLATITQRDVIQISDDNAGRVEDHSKDEVLGVSTGSPVTRPVDSGYS